MRAMFFCFPVFLALSIYFVAQRFWKDFFGFVFGNLTLYTLIIISFVFSPLHPLSLSLSLPLVFVLSLSLFFVFFSPILWKGERCGSQPMPSSIYLALAVEGRDVCHWQLRGEVPFDKYQGFLLRLVHTGKRWLILHLCVKMSSLFMCD